MGGNVVAPAPKSPADSTKLDERSSDEILDHYLSNTSYFHQTLLSLSTATASVWRKQCFGTGAYETRDKLKMFWTNIGIVSALLLGVSYSSALTPITSDNPDLAMACSIAAVFSGLSVIFSLTVIVMAVIYLVEIDNCMTERDLKDFIYANAPIVDILTGVFSGSVVMLLVAALTSMYITYGRTEFLIVICVSGAITMFGAVFAAVLAGHNRFRLWIRYDSKEGRALVERLKRNQLLKLDALKDELVFQERELSEIKTLMELKEIKDDIDSQAKSLA